MIALRRATQADVGGITALVHAAYTPWIPILGREPGPMGFDYAKWVAESVVDLHHVEGELAALIQMKPAVDHLIVINLAVAPPFQGRGLGRALMAYAEQTAHAQNLREIRLFTNKLMVSNLRLYERLGYGIDREESYRGGMVVHMSKTLNLDRDGIA